MISTLQYAKKLEGVGYTREQAEAHMEIIVEMIEDQLVTKQDFKDLENRTDRRFEHIEAKMDQLENRLLVKLGGIAAVVATISISILALILK